MCVCFSALYLYTDVFGMWVFSLVCTFLIAVTLVMRDSLYQAVECRVANHRQF